MLGILLAVCLLAACSQEPAGSGTDSGKAPESPPPSVKTEPAPASSKPVVQVTQETRDTYHWYCTQCHGVHGKGDGLNATHLAVPPRDHTKAEYLETRTDTQLFEVIRKGGLAGGRAPCMPAWGHTLSEEMIASLVRYIRELCQCEAM
ncbi:MAG: cytochrome C [Nitrospinae bacterium CG11_big_fil_rev_8_21_14_0_20_56_8]|nr:MAG: cytochrome C [Nitrospinae bacterium CG11_big_fil_rev_8_21_14_0_20_56_8]